MANIEFEYQDTPHFVLDDERVGVWHVVDREDVFTNEGGDVTDAIVWHESWVENVYRLSTSMFTGGAVVDLGANIGAFSTLCLAIEPTETVVAVEPTADNRALLEANLLANDGFQGRYTVLPYAVGSKPGTCSMAANGGAAHVVEGDEVEVVTLGSVDKAYLSDLEIDVLKCDIEGAEWDLFSRSSDAWATLGRARHLVMEWHGVNHRTLGDFLGRLAETHAFQIIGVPKRGGMLYGQRHDV